jgi:hypothetical protein
MFQFVAATVNRQTTIVKRLFHCLAEVVKVPPARLLRCPRTVDEQPVDTPGPSAVSLECR